MFNQFVINRFNRKWKLVSSGCHEWAGKPDSWGYGRITINGGTYLAHRVSYEINVGEISSGKVICHSCDNPICVNPNHLFQGTHADNVSDRVKKNRSARGTNNGRAKLTPEHVKEIRIDASSSYNISKRYNVDPKLIRLIKKQIIWKNI